MEEGNCEVYIVKNRKGEVLYVGEGKEGRHKHCTSGVSHVYELNKLHFSGAFLSVEVLKRRLTKEESRKQEGVLIESLKPKLNKKSSSQLGGIQSASTRKKLLDSVQINSPKEYWTHDHFFLDDIFSHFGVVKLVEGFTRSELKRSKISGHSTLMKTGGFYREHYSNYFYHVNKSKIALKDIFVAYVGQGKETNDPTAS